MSQPGWYPDPAGAPGRYRYWDGAQWSSQTVDQPSSSPRSKGGLKLFVAMGIVLVLLIVAGVFVVRGLFTNTSPTVEPAPLPSSTVGGGDDRSPTTLPTTAPSSPTPSPSVTTPSPVPSAQPEPCPQGEPDVRDDHPNDGRYHGGGLSMPPVAGWSAGPVDQFSWAYDVATQLKVIEKHWVSNMAVGALSVVDFDDPRTAAERVVQCTITSSFYSSKESRVVSRKDLSSQAVTVDGYPGWALRTEIRIKASDVQAAGDILEVIVVDTDQPESLAMFMGTATIGDDQTLAQLDRTIGRLRVD